MIEIEVISYQKSLFLMQIATFLWFYCEEKTHLSDLMTTNLLRQGIKPRLVSRQSKMKSHMSENYSTPTHF